MDVIGRSYMLITSGNLRVNGAMNTIGSITSRCSGIRAHAPSPEPHFSGRSEHRKRERGGNRAYEQYRYNNSDEKQTNLQINREGKIFTLKKKLNKN